VVRTATGSAGGAGAGAAVWALLLLFCISTSAMARALSRSRRVFRTTTRRSGVVTAWPLEFDYIRYDFASLPVHCVIYQKVLLLLSLHAKAALPRNEKKSDLRSWRS
jgi:uncharacterized membrane protein YpjA